MQILYEELENFLKNANSYERLILQRYVDRSKNLYGIVSFFIYLGCLGCNLEPIIFARHQFPTESSYPFDVDSHPIFEILYALQCLAIFHLASGLFIDTQVAVLLWFTGARFEMLGNEFENVSNPDELYCCIKKHQELIRFAHEVRSITKFIALATITTSSIGILCGGLVLISVSRYSVINIRFVRKI